MSEEAVIGYDHPTDGELLGALLHDDGKSSSNHNVVDGSEAMTPSYLPVAKMPLVQQSLPRRPN